MEEKRLSPEEIKARLKRLNEGKKAKASTKGRSARQDIKLLYIRDYLHRYTNKENPKSANDIIEYLDTKNIKAERKTIYHDIGRLKEELNEPIAYNPKLRGYYITKPQFNSYELRMLLDSVRISETLTTEETLAIYSKILGLANIYDAEYFSNELAQRKLRWKATISETHNAELITEAIKTNRKISFRYFHYVMDRGNKYKEYYRLNDSNDIYIISPKELKCSYRKYRVITDINGEERYFPLEFMEDIKILSQDNEHIASKSITTKEADVYDMLVEREAYTLDLSKKYAVTILTQDIYIKDIFNYWGYDTPIIPYEQGSVIFTIHTRLPSRPLCGWMVRFAQATKILAPIEAIGEYVGMLHEIIEMYGYGTPDYLKNIPSTYDEMRKQKHTVKPLPKIQKKK